MISLCPFLGTALESERKKGASMIGVPHPVLSNWPRTESRLKLEFEEGPSFFFEMNLEWKGCPTDRVPKWLCSLIYTFTLTDHKWKEMRDAVHRRCVPFCACNGKWRKFLSAQKKRPPLAAFILLRKRCNVIRLSFYTHHTVIASHTQLNFFLILWLFCFFFICARKRIIAQETYLQFTCNYQILWKIHRCVFSPKSTFQ